MHLLVLFSALLALVAPSSALHLVQVEGVSPLEVHHLADLGFDVRSFMDSQCLLVEEDLDAIESTLKVLRSQATVSFVGEFSANQKMFLLQSELEQGHSIWFENTVQVLLEKKVNFYRIFPRIVAFVQAESDIQSLEPFLLRETNIIDFPEDEIKFPSRSLHDRIASMIGKVEKRASIAELIGQVEETQLRNFAEFLTGEAPQSGFNTRLSTATDSIRAFQWVNDQFLSFGMNSSLEFFRDGYVPNVIAEWRGTENPDEIVVLGAHLDCRAANINDPLVRAPGANDDGSGSSSLLEIARIVSENRATFKKTVRIGAWGGEEQGLYGSRYHAQNTLDENVVAMLQMDMTAYNRPGTEPECAYVNRFTDSALTEVAKEVGRIYVPEITQVESSACCSDHQSFYEQGIPSVGYVEGGGYTIDPEYHRTGDAVNRDGYDLNQLSSITKSVFATLAVLAELNE